MLCFSPEQAELARVQEQIAAKIKKKYPTLKVSFDPWSTYVHLGHNWYKDKRLKKLGDAIQNEFTTTEVCASASGGYMRFL